MAFKGKKQVRLHPYAVLFYTDGGNIVTIFVAGLGEVLEEAGWNGQSANHSQKDVNIIRRVKTWS